MSVVEVRIPKLGISMQDGFLAEVLVADGEHVEGEAPLYTLETDKVTQEIPAPASGTVRWLVEPDASYDVGVVVAEISPDGS